MKHDRQSEIISLIGEKEIETQEELLAGLRAKGYMVTQATISRDIRELKLVKVSVGAMGRYKYALPHREENTISKKYRNLLIETVEKNKNFKSPQKSLAQILQILAIKSNEV